MRCIVMMHNGQTGMAIIFVIVAMRKKNTIDNLIGKSIIIAMSLTELTGYIQKDIFTTKTLFVG
jgi:hypothetical protein